MDRRGSRKRRRGKNRKNRGIRKERRRGAVERD